MLKFCSLYCKIRLYLYNPLLQSESICLVQEMDACTQKSGVPVQANGQFRVNGEKIQRGEIKLFLYNFCAQ